MKKLTLLLAALSTVASAQTGGERTLRPGDKFSVIVLGTAYSGEYTVLADGSIDGRGIGKLDVSGMTISGVKRAFETKLKTYVKSPKVTVVVEAIQRDIVNVSDGEKSGPIDLLPGTDLRTLIASVPLHSEPELVEASLHRPDGSTREINVSRLLRGEEGEWNGKLVHQDTLVVLPKRTIQVWFTGAFEHAGTSRIYAGVDLYRAAAQAGMTKAEVPSEFRYIVSRGDQRFSFPIVQNLVAPEFKLHDLDAVALIGPNKIRLTLMGEVGVQGERIVNDGTPLESLLASSGGASALGSLRNVIIYRNNTMLQVDLTNASVGKGLTPVSVTQNDIVLVRKNERCVYALGNVGNAGKYLIGDHETLRMMDLLSRCGGISGRGSLRRVTLLHPMPDGTFQRRSFNLDEFTKLGNQAANPVLQDGEIVYFGDAPVNILSNAFGILSGGVLIRAATGG